MTRRSPVEKCRLVRVVLGHLIPFAYIRRQYTEFKNKNTVLLTCTQCQVLLYFCTFLVFIRTQYQSTFVFFQSFKYFSMSYDILLLRFSLWLNQLFGTYLNTKPLHTITLSSNLLQRSQKWFFLLLPVVHRQVHRLLHQTKTTINQLYRFLLLRLTKQK